MWSLTFQCYWRGRVLGEKVSIVVAIEMGSRALGSSCWSLQHWPGWEVQWRDYHVVWRSWQQKDVMLDVRRVKEKTQMKTRTHFPRIPFTWCQTRAPPVQVFLPASAGTSITKLNSFSTGSGFWVCRATSMGSVCYNFCLPYPEVHPHPSKQIPNNWRQNQRIEGKWKTLHFNHD